MTNKEPKVSIIVPALNEEKNISKLISSLLKLNYKNYKIILVLDKNTIDKTKEIASKFKNKKIKIIQSKKAGSAANRNLGYLESDKDTEYYAFTDSDCYVDKNWLKSLVNVIEKCKKEILGVGGINPVPKNDSPFAKLIGKIESTLLGGGNTAQTKISNKIREVISIPNCNAIYRKEVWQKYKQDETLIKGQDGEFNYRIYKDGGKFIVTPKAIVWHHRHNSLKEYLKRVYNYGIASSKILKKQKNKIEFILSRWYGFLPVIYFISLAILIILSLSNKIFLGILIAFIIPYIAAILLTTIYIIFVLKNIESLKTPFILISQHVAYSLGILKEVLR